MKNKILVANLKCNYKLDEMLTLINFFDNLNLNKNIIIFPTNIYIPYFKNKKYALGIQDISPYGEGAYTGLIAASQAKSLNVEYVLLGHIESKKYQKEELLTAKINECLKNNLKVILCVSSIDELNYLTNINLENIYLAYEPIEYVGTNSEINVNMISYNIAKIKEIIYNQFGYKVRVLYGGSINHENIKDLANISLLDGYLIGTSALSKEKFLKIKEVIDNQ